ncbi:hypothetical protein Nepgr_000256 [Nepenthes gracilis]|uniref:Late embryogenesis abundant protein LEA-2 subgroup domain-containing protein n=1 Tax=Nepenthes gracilis TaxID=150966 RepID=A0AAD3P672_NEPGR|nr:hypothetical protein Nepgr_000256 [Nepenthes gracilis]
MNGSSRPATGYPVLQNSANNPPIGAQSGTTAYPYVAPPPQSNFYNNINPNPYYDPAYATRRAAFYRRFIAGMISVFVIFGVVLFIMWLVLRPRVPRFSVISLSVSQFNVSSSSQISGNWNVLFTVSNPNDKLHAYYDTIETYVFYQSQLLAQNELAPFDQGTKSQTNLTAKLVAASAYVDGKALSGINEDRSHGSVTFNLRILALVRFKAGSWRARRRLLRVSCVNLSVGVSSNSSNGTLTGGPRKCDVVV